MKGSYNDPNRPSSFSGHRPNAQQHHLRTRGAQEAHKRRCDTAEKARVRFRVSYAGVPLGSGASMLIAGYIAPRYGWRACFYVLGGLGLLLVPLVLMIRNPARGQAEAAERTELILFESGQHHVVRPVFATIQDLTPPRIRSTVAGGASLGHGFGASTTGDDMKLLLKILLCLVCALGLAAGAGYALLRQTGATLTNGPWRTNLTTGSAEAGLQHRARIAGAACGRCNRRRCITSRPPRILTDNCCATVAAIASRAKTLK